MSKESYARGFVKAAAAAGVDPVALAKFAQEKRTSDDNNDAGIGSIADNFGRRHEVAQPVDKSAVGVAAREFKYGKPHPGSYLEALRMSGHPSTVPSRSDFGGSIAELESKDEGQDLSIRKGRLARARNDQARRFAEHFFPAGSAPMEALVNNLIRAGEQNYKSYLETGTVPKRNSVDRTGIRKLKIPNLLEKEEPGDQIHIKKKYGIENMDDWLKVLQNSMVRKGPAKTQGNIA